MSQRSLTLDVVIPTYRRPRELERCLAALGRQSRLPDRVIVVARDDDAASQAVVKAAVARLPTLDLVTVVEPGVIAAMSIGVAASTAEIIAFTDDDAAPRPDWGDRLLAHFRDQGVGAVGGRDVIPGQEGPLTSRVGKFDRYGRFHGNHHLGTGQARAVDVLKGVNIAFRAEALALPAPGRLRGTGAQVDWEMVSCAHIRSRGWRVVYDPELKVDHEGAARHGADRRVKPDRSAVLDASYNSVIATAAFEGSRGRRVMFTVAVGSRDRPGPLRAPVALVRADRELLRRLAPSLAGRLLAIPHLLFRGLSRRRPLVVTAGDLRRGILRRPHVTLVAHDIHDNGGMERACAELIRHTHHEVSYTAVTATLAAELRPLVDRWVRIPAPRRPFPLKFGAFFIMAGLAVRRTRSGLVHTIGAIVPNRVDVASVHYCHAGHRAATGSLAPPGAPLLRRTNTMMSRFFALAAEQWCYRPSRLRSFAAVSSGVAAEVEVYYPRMPVWGTPNGIDVERFHPDQYQRRSMRSGRVGVDQCVALFVGGDWDRKGLALAVEAIAGARAEGADVVLWIVGTGDVERLLAFAEGLGIADRLTFFGARADTERFYQAADLFLLPSAYETFSLVCFEAAACGLPLLIPRIHGAGQLVGDDEAGLVVDRDPVDLVRAIVKLTNDIELRSRLGAEARRRATAFTWSASASSVTAIYRMLLEDSSQTPISRQRPRSANGASTQVRTSA